MDLLLCSFSLSLRRKGIQNKSREIQTEERSMELLNISDTSGYLPCKLASRQAAWKNASNLAIFCKHNHVTSIVLLLVCYLLWLQWRKSTRSRNPLSRIPGPMCLPFIGSILSIGFRPHVSLTKHWKRYGDVFRIQIGSVPVVVLNGINVIREATVDRGDTFSGRPGLYTFKLASEGKSMAFNSYSHQWKVHHRLAERALRLVVKEGNFLSRVVVEEAKKLADVMSNHVEPFNPVDDITWSVAHVMYSLCYGDSRKADDFRCMIKSTLRLIQCHKLGNALNFFPYARRFLRRQYHELRLVCNNMIQTTLFKEQDHLETYQEGEIRDALDALIRIGIKRPCPLPQDQVMHTVQEFIGAGLDILYISLSWAVYLCAKHPEIRERMVQEIDSIVGPETEPTEDELKLLTYTHAFILETLRYSCVVPMALPHSTMTDAVLAGYEIPANTMVLINLSSVQIDPAIWGDPEVFRPSRFIDENTGLIAPSVVENHGAFGFGRRRCIGEHLGRQQLVLYLAVLLRRCQIEGIPIQSEDDDTSAFGVVVHPKPFKIRVSSRL